MSLEEVEAFLIKKALARYNGNVSHAANALGLSRSALYRRLQRYGSVIQVAGGPLQAQTRSRTAHAAAGAGGRTAGGGHGDGHPVVAGRLFAEGAVDADVVIVLGGWWAFAAAVRDRVASPLRTLANLLEAMREGDYSIRARGAEGEDALGDVMLQVNAMATTLREQRLGALEATTLLRKVMEEIDVAVFAFDGEQHLRLVNRAGERLLAQPSERS